MPIFTAAVGSVTGISLLSQLFTTDASSIPSPSISALINPSKFSKLYHTSPIKRPFYIHKVSVSGSAQTEESEDAVTGPIEDSPASSDVIRQDRMSAGWKAAKGYYESGVIYEGKIEGFNGGGLLVRFYSLIGFLPFPLLSPSHACKEPRKSIQEIAKGLVGSLIPMKVIQADENNRKLIFSEKEAIWFRFSKQINVGDIFEARVGSVEDYGAFVHLRFPDGFHHLTGLVHVSEVSWDLVQDVRDFLNEGDEVRVKIINIDR